MVVEFDNQTIPLCAAGAFDRCRIEVVRRPRLICRFSASIGVLDDIAAGLIYRDLHVTDRWEEETITPWDRDLPF